MNIAIAVGRCIQDNAIYTSINGKQFANVKISVNRGKDKDGNWLSTVLTFQVWGNTAEYANKYVHKGDLISIRGRIDVRTDWDEHINKNRYTYVLTGTNIEKLANAQQKEYTHEDYKKLNDKVNNASPNIKTEQISDEEMKNQMKVFTKDIEFTDNDLPF